MIRVIIGLLLLFTAPREILSQTPRQEILPQNQFIRFNILGLADPLDANLTVGYENRFNSKWSAGTEAGWIFYSKYIPENRGSNGLIVRPFLRHYPSGRNTFWEAELHYKYVAYKMEDWVGRVPVNNVATYEEYTRFNINKNAVGLHFKWGIIANLSSDKRLKFEYTTGLGIRFKWHHVKDGIYRTGGLFNDTRSEPFVGPAFPVNLRLTYVLK